METKIIIELIALVVALFAPFATHILALSRERHCAKKDFRAAFSDAILKLTESDVPSAQVVHAFRMQHLAAIQNYRMKVSWFKRSGFDKAKKDYCQISKKCIEVGILSFAASESTDYAKANRNSLLNSIDKLLSYAKAV